LNGLTIIDHQRYGKFQPVLTMTGSPWW
jgi:hypothetical protein